MDKDIRKRLDILCALPEKRENEETVRRMVCDILAACTQRERQQVLAVCRKKLRKMENEKCRTASFCRMKQLDMGKLLENVCLCADILLCDKGKTLSCSFQSLTGCCCPELIIDAFLNLISNSAKFGKGKEIGASLFSKGESCIILVENEGSFAFGECSRSSGINAAARAAALHAGRLLYSSSGGTVRAGVSLPCLKGTGEKYQVPAFSAFLSDEFSPVHVGLSDLE